MAPVMKVVFVTPAGDRVEVEAEIGVSLMLAALINGVDGIIGECGGGLVCGTCHAYIDEPYVEKVPALQHKEDDLLEFATERRPNSRLCCQILMSKALQGIVVHLPASQP